MEHPLYILWYGPRQKLEYFWRHRVKKLPARLRFGFWPDECWNLDVTFARHILPRLKYLKNHSHGYPLDLTQETWDRYLDEMTVVFEWIAGRGYYDFPLNNDGLVDGEALRKLTDDAQHGLELFAKYYMDLRD